MKTNEEYLKEINRLKRRINKKEKKYCLIIDKKEEEIIDLIKQINKLEENKKIYDEKNLVKDLNSKKRKIHTLEKQARKRIDANKKLRAKITDKNSEISDLKKDIRKKNNEIKEKTEEIKQIKQIHNSLFYGVGQINYNQVRLDYLKDRENQVKQQIVLLKNHLDKVQYTIKKKSDFNYKYSDKYNKPVFEF